VHRQYIKRDVAAERFDNNCVTIETGELCREDDGGGLRFAANKSTLPSARVFAVINR